MSSNSEYWKKRENDALKNRITDEEEYDKQVNKIYQDMLDSCQREINSFYGKYASKEGITIAEAKKRVSELDVKAFERKAAKYVTDRDFSDKANEELRLYNATMKINRLEMLKANIGLELISGHEELEKFMSDILQGRTEDELKRQAGILGKTIMNNAKGAHAIANASFKNATFSDRIWMYQDLLKNDLNGLLQSGLIQGKGSRELARELEKKFSVRKSDAERLMRTELARVQTEAQKQEYIENGFDMYTFHCIGNDGKTCDVCRALDGKHFYVKDMMPGENAAPLHPRCRCSTSPYSDRKEYEAWLDFISDGGTTEEWNSLGLSEKRKQEASFNRGYAAGVKIASGIKNPLNYTKNGSIINDTEMFKKSRVETDDFKTISEKRFNDLTVEARSKGAIIMRGTPEVEKHLEEMGASASAIGNVLLFRKNVRIGEVLEETYHFMQNINGLNDDKGEPLRTFLNEIDAKKYIINNASKYNVPRNEVELAKKELEYYENKLSEYKEGDS